MPRTRVALPQALVDGAERFACWRAERTTHRIPEELWSLATDLGNRFGASRASRALGVAYGTLRQRMEAVPPAAAPEMAPSTFVEVRASPAPAERPGSCRVEFERPSGERMRVYLGDGCDGDLSRLTRVFLGDRS